MNQQELQNKIEIIRLELVKYHHLHLSKESELLSVARRLGDEDKDEQICLRRESHVHNQASKYIENIVTKII